MAQQSLFPGHAPARYEYGAPDDARLGGLQQLFQMFMPFRSRVEKEPVPAQRLSDEEVIARGLSQYDPNTGFPVEHYTEAVPGEYGPAQQDISYAPAARFLSEVPSAAKAGLEFFGDLFMDPETRERAANVMKGAAEQVPDMAKELTRQQKLIFGAAQQGQREVVDPETGQVLDTSDATWYAPLTVGAGTLASLRNVPVDGKILGTMGGRRATSFDALKAEYDRILETLPLEERNALRNALTGGPQDIQILREMASKEQMGGLESEKLSTEYFNRQALLASGRGSEAPTDGAIYYDEVEDDFRMVIDPNRKSDMIFKGRFLPREEFEALDPPLSLTKQAEDRGPLRGTKSEQRAARMKELDEFQAMEKELKGTPLPDEMIDALTGFRINDQGNLSIGRVFQFSDPLGHERRQRLGLPEDYKIKTTLEEVLDDPVLFREYPQLRHVKVVHTHPMDIGTKGFYDADTRTIGLKPFDISDNAGKQDLKSTLMHEVQHAIQHIEGHSPGASPRLFETREFKKFRDDFETIQKDAERDTANVVNEILDETIAKLKHKADIDAMHANLGKPAVDWSAKGEDFGLLGDMAVKELYDLSPEINARVQQYLQSKLKFSDQYDLYANNGLTYEEALASGGPKSLNGTYPRRYKLTSYLGQDFMDKLNKHSDRLLDKASRVQSLKAEVVAQERKNREAYFRNPGEVNARLASLLNVGFRKDKALFKEDGVSENFVKTIESALPGRLKVFRGRNNELQHVEFVEPVSGRELARLFTPNELRPFAFEKSVAEGFRGPADKSQLTNPDFMFPPARSLSSSGKGARDGSRVNYLRNRVAYLRGSLEQDTDPRTNRRRIRKEAEALENELNELLKDTGPEELAQGGPVGISGMMEALKNARDQAVNARMFQAAGMQYNQMPPGILDQFDQIMGRKQAKNRQNNSNNGLGLYFSEMNIQGV